MVIKGIDVGYQYTKDNDGNIFKSAYSKHSNSYLKETNLVIDGEKYYVGYGHSTTDYNKSNSTINKVCTLYSIASTQKTYDIDYIISVGLPISQYSTQKENLEKSILDYNNSDVYFNGRKMYFNIKKVFVSPQGLSSIYAYKNLNEMLGEYTIIDIGGGTIDSCLVEFDNCKSEVQKYNTYYKGIKTLFDEIIETINNKFELRLGIDKAEKILMTGRLEIEGTPADLNFLKPLLQDYIDGIVENIKINYPVKTSKILLCGGGSKLTYNQLKKHLKNVDLIEDSQFSNAKGYYNIAREMK